TIIATGQRPDFSFARELQLDLHPIVESTRALGPLIDPNVHYCGSVPPHGWRELAHREPDYFVAGIKSYGRAPAFLLPTGYDRSAQSRRISPAIMWRPMRSGWSYPRPASALELSNKSLPARFVVKVRHRTPESHAAIVR